MQLPGYTDRCERSTAKLMVCCKRLPCPDRVGSNKVSTRPAMCAFAITANTVAHRLMLLLMLCRGPVPDCVSQGRVQPRCSPVEL